MGLADTTADGIEDLVVLSVLGAELWNGASDGTFAFGESIVGDDDLARRADHRRPQR